MWSREIHNAKKKFGQEQEKAKRKEKNKCFPDEERHAIDGCFDMTLVQLDSEYFMDCTKI